MQSRLKWTTILVPIVIVGCQVQDLLTVRSGSLNTDIEKASYALGFDIGTNFRPTRDYFDLNSLIQGIEDALAENDPVIAPDSLQAARTRVATDVQSSEAKRIQELSDKNLADGDAFLDENSTKEGVITTDSGLQYEILRQGDGPRPNTDSRVKVHYRGTLLDGTEFDSSYDRGSPSEFSVNGVIPGFSEGLQLMPVGSHYRIFIPGDLAYGQQGAGGTIGPNALLIFEIELQEIL